jgi:hypothetical protein
MVCPHQFDHAVAQIVTRAIAGYAVVSNNPIGRLRRGSGRRPDSHDAQCTSDPGRRLTQGWSLPSIPLG